MRIKEFVRKNVEATTTSIKLFREQPLNSLGQLFPVGMVCTSIIGFIVAIILFVLCGGFTNQISALSGDFFGGISEGFTSGTVGVLTTGIVSTVITVLLFAELIVLIMSYFKTETTVKKVIASICLCIGLILFGIAGFILAIGFGVIDLSYEMEMKIAEMLMIFNGVQNSTIISGLKITALVGLVALVTFIILMFISSHRWMIKNCAVALLITYIIFPLALLLIENIIPMIVGVVAIVFIGGAIFLGCKIFLSGGGETSGSSSTGGSVGTSSSTSRTESKPKEKYQQKKEYDLNTMFWRDKGGYGIAVPQADCIYMKNAWGEKTYVCTVHDFEKGNVAIINKRVRVTNVAGCKTPER